jgi:high-affinity iron transporter
VITVGTTTAFDISAVLPHSGNISETGPIVIVGSLLRALFGYSSTPEWATLIAWAAYLAVVLPLYLRPVKPSAPRPVQQGQPAVGA